MMESDYDNGVNIDKGVELLKCVGRALRMNLLVLWLPHMKVGLGIHGRESDE